MRVAVVGCGYVGLVTGVGLASVGHDVTGIEVDEARLLSIQRGVPPFHEPRLPALLKATLQTGRFRMAANIDQVADAEVVAVCAPTPGTPDGAIDLRILRGVMAEVASAFGEAPGRRVVAVRSTVPPRTTQDLLVPLFAKATQEVALAVNPEFLREGSAVEDFLHPDRIVVGTTESWAADQLAALYEPLGANILRTAPTTAEIAKLVSNAFLATLISFSNEIARICEHLPGIDVEEVLHVLHEDRRFSQTASGGDGPAGILSYLKSGCGFGGGCLPKDTAAISAFARDAGEPAHLLEAVLLVNEAQALRLVDMAEEELGNLRGQNLTVLGVAFKAGTDDLRGSPGLKVVDILLQRGARVTVFDPLVTAQALEVYTERGVRVAATLGEAVQQAGACLVTSAATEFASLGQLVGEGNHRRTVVIDGRRSLPPDVFPPGIYRGVGVGGGHGNRASFASGENGVA